MAGARRSSPRAQTSDIHIMSRLLSGGGTSLRAKRADAAGSATSTAPTGGCKAEKGVARPSKGTALGPATSPCGRLQLCPQGPSVDPAPAEALPGLTRVQRLGKASGRLALRETPAF